MNCAIVFSLLDAYIDGELAPSQVTELNLHLNGCLACQAKFTRAQQVINLLRNAPIDPPLPGFHEKVFERVHSLHGRGERTRWITVAGGSLAASFALLLLFMPIASRLQPLQEIPTVVFETALMKTINLAFNAPQEFNHVTLTIELPANFELVGFPNQSSVTWNTALSPGKNVLALPVIATAPRDGVLIARLTSGEKSKIFSIRVIAEHQRDEVSTQDQTPT